MIDCVVAPFDHEYELAAGALNVTEPPAQNVVGPDAVIVVDGSGFTVTTVGAEVALQAPLTVTVYEPDVETLIDCPVSPVDQVYE